MQSPPGVVSGDIDEDWSVRLYSDFLECRDSSDTEWMFFVTTWIIESEILRD